ncbi:MAG: multidrug effflux MFS transporter [Burkholderiales bacterium]|nr:multidrug effflux MFS transporter [Burkholderiales bacterium]
MKRAAPSTTGVAVMVAVAFALLPLSTDLYLASLPALRRYFDIGVSEAQLTLSAFIVGFALSQLVYGPLSDCFGRRPVLIAGLAIYLGASLAAMFAPSIAWLIGARFLQAVGACSGAVIGRAIVRDVFGATGAARMLGYITAVSSLGPLFGPIAGSLIEVLFGWRGAFAALATVGGALLVAVVWRLGESNPSLDAAATDVRGLAGNYRRLLRDRRYLGYVGVVAFTYAGIFSFVSGSAFVLIEVLGVPPKYFGFLYAAAVLGYISMNLVVGRIAMRAGIDRLLKVGTALCVVGGTAMAGLALARVQSVTAFVLPMFVFFLGAGFNMPAAMAGAIGPYPKMAGTASALLGFLQMVIGGLAGFTVGRLHDGTTVPTSVSIASAGILAAASFYALVAPGGAARREG